MKYYVVLKREVEEQFSATLKKRNLTQLLCVGSFDRLLFYLGKTYLII